MSFSRSVLGNQLFRYDYALVCTLAGIRLAPAMEERHQMKEGPRLVSQRLEEAHDSGERFVG
jgi:hypothetical protein